MTGPHSGSTITAGDVLIQGGTVATASTNGIEIARHDVYVEGSRIAAVGATPSDAAVTIDARGMLVLPGFIQAHTHFCQTIFRGLADDLDVLDWLRLRIWPLEQAHTPESLFASAALASAELLLGGTTTAVSMETTKHTAASFEAAAQVGIRAWIGKAIMDRFEPGTDMIGESTDEAWADVIQLIEKWHGACEGRLQFVLSPRAPRAGTHEMWRRCVQLADELDLRLHTHVNENRHQADRISALGDGRDVEALHAWGALGPRMIMAHAVWLDDNERDIVRRLRPNVCHCPTANLKLASGIAPIPGYLSDGITVTLGADGAACNNRLDMFSEMRLAAILHRPGAGPRVITAENVFRMATINGARALGREHDLGSIEMGKLADIVLVERGSAHSAPDNLSDPLSQIVFSHTSSDVRHVLVNGQPVVVDGELQGPLTERSILDQARKMIPTLVNRSGVYQ